MPLALLTQIPFIYRALAIIALIAAVFFYGYEKGANTEHDRFAAQQAEEMQKQLAFIQVQNKALSEQMFASQKKQEEIKAKNDKQAKEIADLVAKNANYRSKQCQLDPEIIKKLRGE